MQKETWRHTLILSFQSLGVIYGRLSTAPLYVLESIDPGDIKSPSEIHELFSFIFWTLTIIPLLKYAFIVLRADDAGEGNGLDNFWVEGYITILFILKLKSHGSLQVVHFHYIRYFVGMLQWD